MTTERVGFEEVYGTIKPGDHATGDDQAIYELERIAFQAGAAWQRAQGAGVPDGYMPIPTAEQLAEALANVRCFHDLSAELIAPELLKNLLAAAPAHGKREG